MSKTKKIAILAIIAMVLTLMPTALFAATADSTRLSGDNRIATALDIASAGWTTAGTVVLAPADQANLVDALAAAPLAGQENAPILLTYKGSLDAAVKAKIADLKATKVFVVGAITDTVAAEVDAISGVTVETLRGVGRVGTAQAVNTKVNTPAGTFIVGYDAIPDALSVASYAAKNKFAIVLANSDGTVDASSLVGATKYIVGGTTKVKDITGVERISGDNRFATNTAVAEKLSYTYDRVYVAGGLDNNLVDALAVAPLAAKYNAFVALASGSEVAASSVVNAKLVATSKVIAVGGANAVSDAVVAKVAYAVPSALAVTSVTALNANEIQVVFNRNVDKDLAQALTTYKIGAATNAALATLSGADTAKLQSDNKTVKIKFSATGVLGATACLANKTAYTFEVTKDIKDTEGNALAKVYTTDIFFSDTVKPTVTSVAANEGATVKITFSERIGTLPTVIINGTAIAAGNVTVNADNGAVVDVAVPAALNLKSGTSYPIIVSTGTDLGGYNAMDLYSGNFTYSYTSNAPYVKSLTAKDEKTIVVEFSELLNAAITGAEMTVNRGTTAIALGPITAVDGKNNKFEVELATASLYASGTTTSTLTVVLEGYKDVSLNLGSKYTATVVVTKDTEKPSITKAEYNFTTKNITFTFNEKLAAVAAAAVDAGLVITDDSNGVVKTPVGAAATAIAAGDKTLTISNAAGALNLDAGTYTFSFASSLFVDQSIAANKSNKLNITVPISGSNTDKPTVTAAVQAANNVFTVTFSEAVKGGVSVAGSATDIANYKLNGAALPAGTNIALNAAKTTATVTMPSSSVAKTQVYVLSVANVQDLGGVAMDAHDRILNLTDTLAPTLVSASVNTDNEIIAVFSEQINGANDDNGNPTVLAVAGDFIVTVNGVDLNAASVTVALITGTDNKAKLKITSNAANFATGTIVLKTANPAGNLTGADAAANTLKKDVSVSVTR